LADRTRPPHPLGAVSHDAPVLVIGLGRFGAATAGQLERQDREVLVVDTDAGLVQKWSDRVTHAVQADATDIDALRQIGAGDFPIAVVGTGSDLESSVLITANLVDLGIPQIWAKAISRSHGTILSRIGANHIVYPEREAGERTAHLVSGRMLDFIEFDDDFAVVKMFPPRTVRGKDLATTVIRTRFGLTVLGIKPPGEPFVPATPESVIGEHDVIIVSGSTTALERFAALE
jgi:trk system potassium uptake protein TrkA